MGRYGALGLDLSFDSNPMLVVRTGTSFPARLSLLEHKRSQHGCPVCVHGLASLLWHMRYMRPVSTIISKTIRSGARLQVANPGKQRVHRRA
jgi:hypothetical protein